MKIYGYAHHLTHPSGLGIDDEGNTDHGQTIAAGHGDTFTERYQPLPHGTMLRRAVRRLNAAGITNILTHTLPPHPESELGQFMATRCYAEKSAAFDRDGRPSERLAALWSDCLASMLGATNEVLFSCDGSYEAAIQEACASNTIVAGSSLGWLIPTIKLQTMTADGSSLIDHPVLQHLDAMSPGYGYYGRALDIWNPHIVDVLAFSHESLIGPGRQLGGMWLSLGGPMLWGENDRANLGPMYPVRTPAAREALGTSEDISMQKYGRDLAPIIRCRMGRIARELIDRLVASTPCRDFYFHAYPIPPDTYRPESMASGNVGVMQELCERLDGCGAKIHIVVSLASADEISSQNAAHPHDLIRQFPTVEFIAGVGWARRLSTAGVARLCEGYQSLDVGLKDRDDWAALSDQRRRLDNLLRLL